ncbi:laccase TilA [Rhexocercosporidium sp. MPI-PUGE-AT-0058]|nr:laccase TilA [Rhexocercosporidium sp. MPI-PUGE-AT-0058]
MKHSFLSLGLLVTCLASSVLATYKNSEGVDCERTVVFPITLTWERGSPDGFERDMIFMNGHYPGPTLDIEEGDNVEFVVYNKLPYNTTIHFHGIEQLNTPWSDGVPGLTQTGIPPGESFVYKWTATQYGTYWYHGHYRGQLEDGLYGPINIKPKQGTPHPLGKISNSSEALHQLEEALDEAQPVLLSDWSHFTSERLTQVAEDANIDQLCGDSILINGKGSVNCPGVPFLMSLVPPPLLPILAGENLTDKGCLALSNTLAQTTQPKNLELVPPGMYEGCNATTSELAVIEANPHKGWIGLSFISTASIQELVVSIDDHPMWLYGIDGRYVEPQLVDAMTLSHGSRHSVMVQLNKPARDYTIRLAGAGLNQKVFTSGTLSYKGGDHSNNPNASINYAGANTTAVVRYLNDHAVVPFPPVHPAPTVDQTIKLLLNRTGAVWQWSLNENNIFNVAYEDINPLLYNPIGLQDTGLTITTKNNTWVDLIFVVTITGGLQPPHPIHKHSNKAHIIGLGTGEFNYTDVAEAMQYIPESFNLDNPPYRDGFYTLPLQTASTWMAVRYKVENPGPFLLHCHINPHLTGGMSVAILDGYDAWPVVPMEYQPGENGGDISQKQAP